MFRRSLKRNKTIEAATDVILSAKGKTKQPTEQSKNSKAPQKQKNKNPKVQKYIGSSNEREKLLNSIVEKLDTSLNLPEEEVIK